METTSLTKGDYVLATKYNDGDPGDQWCVGFFDHYEDGRYYVVGGDGRQFRANGFRRAERISEERGIWLLAHARAMERSTPGSVNLWELPGPAALTQEPT